MMDESPIQKSLVEQIHDEMFANIERRKEFDSETVAKLKHLATTGGLQKPAQVTDVIKSPPPAPP